MPEIKRGKLTFISSDSALSSSFKWAQSMALSYAHNGDSVGDWYEAALPGRNAFCIRDVAHQAIGAIALGLESHTKNMLRKFVVNISESKDWCTYWEINKDDEPAPVDYKSDKEFWYNLPANYDLISACWKLFIWTGDSTYINDPAFLEFYTLTTSSYENQWDLSPEKVMKRARFMNRDTFDPSDYYQFCRGIPSYHEGNPGMTRIGVDLLAFQAAAYSSYAKILDLNNHLSLSKQFKARSNALNALIENHFWNASEQYYYDLLLTDGKFVKDGHMYLYLLYNNVLTDYRRIRKTLERIINASPEGIELRSHLPEIYYRYGYIDQAYEEILQLCNENTRRREYPEVSFAVVGAVINGLMGIEPAQEKGVVSTFSRLTEKTKYAEVSDLTVQGFSIDLRHEGGNKSILTNKSANPLKWSACFSGNHEYLRLNGDAYPAERHYSENGNILSKIEVIVGPGQTVSVWY